MLSIRHLSKSEAAVFLGLFAAILTIADLLLKVAAPYRIGIGLIALAALVWLVYEIWPHHPHPVSQSGLIEFRTSFDIDETRPILEDTETEFCYFGVSFLSAWSLFKNWYLSPARKNVRSVKLLLADPNDEELLRFSAEWEGKSGSDGEAIARIRERIKQTLREAQALNAPGVEVRFHRKQCREWMYIADDRIFVGLVEKGTERCHNPVMVLKKDPIRAAHWSLYDQYRQEWETLWAGAIVDSGSSARVVVKGLS